MLAGTIQGASDAAGLQSLEIRLAVTSRLACLVLNTAGWLTAGDDDVARTAAVKAGQPIVRRVSAEATADDYLIKGAFRRVAR